MAISRSFKKCPNTYEFAGKGGGWGGGAIYGGASNGNVTIFYHLI